MATHAGPIRNFSIDVIVGRRLCRNLESDRAIMYNQSAIVAQLRKEFGNDVSALCGFYRFYYLRIWQYRPVGVLEKIGRQLAIFYLPKCGAYKSRTLVSLANDYRRGVASLSSESYRKIWTAYPPALQFMDRTQLLAESRQVLRQPACIGKLLNILAATYLPLLLTTLGFGVTLLFHKRHRSRLGCLTAWVLFVYSYSLASCLEVATIHSLEIPRYIDSANVLRHSGAISCHVAHL